MTLNIYVYMIGGHLLFGVALYGMRGHLLFDVALYMMKGTYCLVCLCMG